MPRGDHSVCLWDCGKRHLTEEIPNERRNANPGGWGDGGKCSACLHVTCGTPGHHLQALVVIELRDGLAGGRGGGRPHGVELVCGAG